MSGGGMEQRRYHIRYERPSIDLPKEKRNTEGYISVMREHPELLQCVPRAARCAEICEAAMNAQGYTDSTEWIRNHGEQFPFVLREMYTEEMCLAFFASEYAKNYEPMSGYYNGIPYDGKIGIETIPYKYVFRWKSVCEAAVKRNPRFLAGVPAKYKSIEMCIQALKVDKRQIEYVPQKLLPEVTSTMERAI